MRRALALVAVAAVAFPLAGRAAGEKILQNDHGTVQYRMPHAPPQSLAPKTGIALHDDAEAITGSASLADVLLPDSSVVEVGADTRVRLGLFTQAEGTRASFIVYDGAVRFTVRHPAGAKASYMFATPTATIGVRGTEGDIGVRPDGSLLVNVYELCDPSLPVVVTTKDGRRFLLAAGQSLVAQLVNGVVRAQVQRLSQQLIDRFAPDFGVPSNWDEAKGELVAVAQSRAEEAVNGVTGGLGGSIAVQALGGLFSRHRATPTPSPTPASSCT